jgi:fucose permease
LTGAAAGGLLAGQGLKPLAHFTIVAILLGGAALLTFPHLLEKTELPKDAAAKRGPTPVFSWPTRGLMALGLIALCIMVGEGAMADWSAVYLRNCLGTRESLAAAGYAAFSIAMAGGRFLGDRLTADFGPMKLARAGALLAAGGLLLALTFHNTAVALAGFACVGLGYATIVPMVFSAAGHRPGTNPDIAVASVTTLGYLGFLIGPPLIGFVAQGLGLRCALGMIVAASVVAAVLAPSLGNRLNSHAGDAGELR